jgi:hypothetical protein
LKVLNNIGALVPSTLETAAVSVLKMKLILELFMALLLLLGGTTH